MCKNVYLKLKSKMILIVKVIGIDGHTPWDLAGVFVTFASESLHYETKVTTILLH